MALQEDTSCYSAKELVQELENFMATEFEKLGTRFDEFSYENFLVYKEAFSHIVNHSVLIKQNLSNFKFTLDEEIMNAHRKLEQNKCQADPNLESELSQSTLETLTLRKNELLQQYQKVDMENRKLLCAIENIKLLIEDARKVEVIEEEDPYKSKLIDDLTLDQMTNVNFLSRELGKTEGVYQAEVSHLTTKFVSKQKYEDLQDALNKKEEKKTGLLDEIDRTGKSYLAMKIFTEKLTFLQQSREEITSEMIQKEIEYALRYAQETSVPTADFLNDDDTLKEEEAELYVAYIENFEELIREQKYAQAALLAATSPNGFLRTMSTIRVFRSIDVSDEVEETNPLLRYVMLLMRTAKQYSTPPFDQSYECVSCAIEYDRYDCIAQWIANGVITFTADIAELLLRSCYCRLRCDCEALTLAQAVFREVGNYAMVAFCLAKQGSFYRAIDAAKATALGDEALLKLLQKVPSLDLASLLVLEENLSLGLVINSLLENHNDNICIGFLRVIVESGDLKRILTSPNAEDDNISWDDIIDLCTQFCEYDLVHQIQAYILSLEAISKAIESISS